MIKPLLIVIHSFTKLLLHIPGTSNQKWIFQCPNNLQNQNLNILLLQVNQIFDRWASDPSFLVGISLPSLQLQMIHSRILLIPPQHTNKCDIWSSASLCIRQTSHNWRIRNSFHFFAFQFIFRTLIETKFISFLNWNNIRITVSHAKSLQNFINICFLRQSQQSLWSITEYFYPYHIRCLTHIFHFKITGEKFLSVMKQTEIISC